MAIIKKILKIKGVGRFKSFATHNDDVAFDKTTVIFGYNTYGKSTLTAIFRSLRDNNARYIYGRKTFGFSGNQEIEILDSNNSSYSFDSKWEDKNIEIFDNEFISKNVFYGDQIGRDQQASLYEILIGEDVYNLKHKIDLAKEVQKKQEESRGKVEVRFTKKDLGSFETFLGLKEDANVKKNIIEIKDKIKQQENIDKLKELVSIAPLKSDFESFKSEFSKSLDLSLQETVNRHIASNWNNLDANKDFLSQGLDLLKEDGGCVFCGQSLEHVGDFIGDLRKVFSDEYKNHKESIKNLGDDFVSIDIEKSFLEFEKYGLNLTGKLDYARLVSAKENIDKKVHAKINDLSLKLDFDSDPDIKAFFEEKAKLTSLFNDITQQPIGDTSMLEGLKKDLQLKELTEYRFSVEGASIYVAYNEAKKSIDDKKEEIKKLNVELEEKVKKEFEDNEKMINHYLKELGANFSIKDLSATVHMGQLTSHYCAFQFVFDDAHVVNISNKTRKDAPEPDEMPHFKNTLSDSDKRILAFAIFLAKLKGDDKLKDKIIILDDPFSSLDENRKDETIKLLTAIKNDKGDEPSQKIILTHDTSFLCRLYNKLPKESRTLKVSYSQASGAQLEYCDVENDFLKDSYFRDIEYIKHSAENSANVDEALKKVRPCIEHLLKRKYYFLLSSDTLKGKSVGKYLDEIDAQCPIKADILADNWHDPMHDGHSIMGLNEPQKISKLRHFLELIKKI